MFKGAKKEDFRRIASELELCVSDKLTVMDLMDLIKNCDRYKNDPDSVHELANLIIDERKSEESQQLELEKIREKAKVDLEIARIRAKDIDNNVEINCNNDSSSLDSLIKTIERVIQPSSVGVQKQSEREGEFLNGQLSPSAVEFEPISYKGKTSREGSSPGVRDLFTATSYA
ncbi:hypothetical protein TNCT_492091 [Trichonephila clavata]|uniref:Uncharacterized protein n=1 Tax=Trichonephila clavata TaxID=2740835 RepID=A0A8X6LJA8_TRICU|nr:hypothetical protein TNCT_492091 [Trichonephila clavata]